MSADADLLDFIPLFPDDTEEAILDRMRAWANEGLDPEVDVDLWVDTREGSHWHVHVMPSVRELARLYDLAGTEVVAATMPVWSWGEYLDDHAEVKNILRLPATSAAGTVVFSGETGTVIDPGTIVGVEPVGPDDPAPEFSVVAGDTIGVGGTVELAIAAVDVGEAGNVAAGAITVVTTPIPSLGVPVTVTNPEPVVGGTDPESDVGLRARILAAYGGRGVGNRRDYEAWARAWAGVGRATVVPLWNGPNTVKVIVSDENGEPVSAPTVAALQEDLDPVAGTGDGTAPVGAIVTVETAVALPIDVAATVEFETGFSLDGAGGGVALRSAIEAAVLRYVESVAPGGEVVLAQVGARIATIAGVHDVGGVLLNGAAVNVEVSADPAQAPQVASTAGIVEGVL